MSLSLGSDAAARADDRMQSFRTLAMRAISVGLVAALIVLVGLPVIRLGLLSLSGPGGLSLEPFFEAFGKVRYVEAFGRSVLIGIAVSAVSTLIGVPMAWLVARTNMPGRNFVTLIVVATFVMPPYVGSVAWALLAGPNAGWINRFWRLVSGAEDPLVNIYSMQGLIFLIALYSFPLSFVFVRSALGLLSTELEDAAAILGARRRKILFAITLPMIWPSIIAGAILILLESVTLFGTPAIIGIPAGITVASTQIWQFFAFPPNIEAASAYSFAILGLALVLLALQRLVLARKEYVSVTGKGGALRETDLGPVGRWLAFSACIAVGVLAVFLPSLIMLQAAFAKTWSLGFTFDNFTLENFNYLIFKHSTALSAVLNTFSYSAVAATVAVFAALVIGYVHLRKLVPGSGMLVLLSVWPVAIPAIVLGVAFYATFAPPPFRLYGTAAILVMAFIVRFLPIAYLNVSATLRSLNPEMEDAVRILGGGRVVALGRVVVPIIRSGLLGVWLIVFVAATRELSTALFLTGPQTKVMSVLMMDLSEEGNFEVLSALGFMLLVTAWVVVAIGQRIAGRDFMIGRN